jgi:hypothetical protein
MHVGSLTRLLFTSVTTVRLESVGILSVADDFDDQGERREALTMDY